MAEPREERHLHPGRRHGHRAARPDPAGDGRQQGGRGPGDEQARPRGAGAHRPGRSRGGGDGLGRGGDRVLDRREDVQRRRSASTRTATPSRPCSRTRARAGKATGLVTTSQVTDATPAAYGAHVADRAQQSEIARQYLEGSKPDVILGGGEDFWYPPGEPGRLARQPADGPDRAEQGRPRATSSTAPGPRLPVRERPRRPAPDARGRKLLGLFANEEMFEHREEGHGDLYEPVVPLPEMARKALDMLSQRPRRLLRADRGGGDRRDGAREQRGLMIKSGAALDATVQLAVDFARRHPRHADRRPGRPRDGRPDDRELADERGRVRRGEPRRTGRSRSRAPTSRCSRDWTTGQHTGADMPITGERSRRRALRRRASTTPTCTTRS